MIEIEYRIGELKTSMFVGEAHSFYLITEIWVKAVDLNVGDKILACDGSIAKIAQLNPIEVAQHYGDLRASHNHLYFMTVGEGLPAHPSMTFPIEPVMKERACFSVMDGTPTDPLERIPFDLADRPSKFADGSSTAYHSGPWAAARYLDCDLDLNKAIIGWGCATETMCAEDAALHDLQNKLGSRVELHRGNVTISHAYIRKYTRKGRFVNRMSPCFYCRENYGSALNDTSLGKSVLHKVDRGFLPIKP
ncbi:hypothetical protein [uncultured Shewanella sp.]|uniref:hypothetical protein n=1 Tax=uncultured Shewanella sp. TaxID=173975 RepID=UPI0026086161|nr:hypothetical protein [uncultured Shewanella sp.]